MLSYSLLFCLEVVVAVDGQWDALAQLELSQVSSSESSVFFCYVFLIEAVSDDYFYYCFSPRIICLIDIMSDNMKNPAHSESREQCFQIACFV